MSSQKRYSFKNLPHAILIKGTFSYLRLRSSKGEKKPYRSFSEASDDQGIYHFEEVEGHAIGFWSPKYFGTTTIDGYNFSFINDSLTRGGHVIDMHLKSRRDLIDACAESGGLFT